MTRNGTDRSRQRHMVSFVRHSQRVFQSGGTNLHSHWPSMRVPVAPHPPQYLVLSVWWMFSSISLWFQCTFLWWLMMVTTFVFVSWPSCDMTGDFKGEDQKTSPSLSCQQTIWLLFYREDEVCGAVAAPMPGRITTLSVVSITCPSLCSFRRTGELLCKGSSVQSLLWWRRINLERLAGFNQSHKVRIFTLSPANPQLWAPFPPLRKLLKSFLSQQPHSHHSLPQLQHMPQAMSSLLSPLAKSRAHCLLLPSLGCSPHHRTGATIATSGTQPWYRLQAILIIKANWDIWALTLLDCSHCRWLLSSWNHLTLDFHDPHSLHFFWMLLLKFLCRLLYFFRLGFHLSFSNSTHFFLCKFHSNVLNYHPFTKATESPLLPITQIIIPETPLEPPAKYIT